MARQGYLIVPHSHRLFPLPRVKAIESRVQNILTYIETSKRIKLTPFTFKLTPQSKADRNPSVYMRALFTSGNNAEVRLLFSIDEIEANIISKYFSGSPLILTIREFVGHHSRVLVGRNGPFSGHIDVSSLYADRAIEDFLIDIAIGNFFKQFPPLSDILAREGLAGIYRRKAHFVRERISSSWISAIDKKSTYALISSLNKLDSDEINLRGKHAFEAWNDFSSSLSYDIVSRDRKFIFEDLKRDRKIGGQLPLRKIRTALNKLPSGKYTLIVLRKSINSSKSPKFRNSILQIFTKSSRINSFVIVDNDRFLVQEKFLRQAVGSGHLLVRQVNTALEGIAAGVN